jgi:hypothetical protein
MYELLRGVFLKFLSFVLQKLLLISNKNWHMHRPIKCLGQL